MRLHATHACSTCSVYSDRNADSLFFLFSVIRCNKGGLFGARAQARWRRHGEIKHRGGRRANTHAPQGVRAGVSLWQRFRDKQTKTIFSPSPSAVGLVSKRCIFFFLFLLGKNTWRSCATTGGSHFCFCCCWNVHGMPIRQGQIFMSRTTPFSSTASC